MSARRLFRRVLPSAAFALGIFASTVAPARAQTPERVLPAPPVEDTRALLIESRLTGRHLDAFVDGYSAPGQPRPDAAAFEAALPGFGLVAPSPWSPVPPPALWVHSTIYDPIRDRLVVFGGQGYEGSTNDVWAFQLSGIPHWTRLSPSGPTPAPRGFHSAVYDSANDRMIVFGGNKGTSTNEVWSLSFAGNPTWSQLTPTGTPPAPREWHVAVLDRARNRMIIHGGLSNGTRLGDVWALSLGGVPAWTQITTGGTQPGGRSAHCALVDVARDRLIIFSGINSGGMPSNSLYALSLGATPTWSQLVATGTPPTARYGMSARYDALRARALFFGGGTGAPNTNETWALSLGTTPAWTLLNTPNPPQGRQFHTATYDPFGDRLLVFGGSSGPVLSDTWALPLASPGSSWIPLTSTRRRGHTALFVPPRQRMVVFGGESGAQLNDVWELGMESNGTWARLNPAGTPPPPRALHGAIYDERRDRMIVFGGRGGPAMSDLWELTFSGTLEWHPIQAVGTPPAARFDHLMVYDPSRYRVLVFGGMEANGAFNDVWSLSLGGTPTWEALSPLGSKPSQRGGAVGFYDPSRNRLVIFGGYTQNFTALDDAWQLSLGTATPTWTQLSPSGTKPAPRFASATVYDPTRDRMVLSSGTDFNIYFEDTWELRFTGTGTSSAWAPLGGIGPTGRSDHKAIYDPDGDRLVFFGGFNLGGVLHDTWEMDFVSVVGVPGGPLADGGGRATLALAGANPVHGAARFAFTLPRSASVQLAVHDASGRRVRTLLQGMQEAGSHVAPWDGRDEDGQAVRPGVYFARLVSDDAGGAATAKVVVLN